MITMMYLFFLCGFATVLNVIVVTYIREVMSFSHLQSALVVASFYTGCVVVSPLSGFFFRYKCYLKQIKIGLVLAFLGTYILSKVDDFLPILGCISLIGAGVAMIQVGGNPYVYEGGSRRLSIVQAFTALGMVAAPYYASEFLLNASLHSAFKLIAWLWAAGALFAFFLPKTKHEIHQSLIRPYQEPIVWLGMTALLLAIGIEISVGIYLLPLLMKTLEVSSSDASRLAMIFWGGFVVGRLYIAALLNFASAANLLRWHALMGIGLTLSVIFGSWVAALLLGLCTSVMFPLIYSFIFSRTKSTKSEVSGYLCMCNAGGAMIPLLQGVAADRMGISPSFVVPLCAYAVITIVTFLMETYGRDCSSLALAKEKASPSGSSIKPPSANQ